MQCQSRNRTGPCAILGPLVILGLSILAITGMGQGYNPHHYHRTHGTSDRLSFPADSLRHRPATGRSLSSSDLPSGIDLGLAKKLCEDLLSLIRNRYELEEGPGKMFFYTSHNMGNETWDILKLKFAKKTLQQNSSFHMIFGGSSVTAGHDNYFNQSFPMILEKRMGPIFRALSIDLIVNNIAQGANPCVPYDMCYESMGGYDPDFVAWEQSFNCGHEDAMFELPVRVALFSREKAVVYYSISGGWTPDCPPSKDSLPYNYEEWTEESAGLKKWSPTLREIKEIREELNDFNKAHSPVARFTSWATNDHRGAGFHGFSVWEPNPLCEKLDKDGTVKKGCNGMEVGNNCTLHFMTREAAVYGTPGGHKTHHPTRAMHMLRGEWISYLYTLAMLDSIYMMEEHLGAGSTPKELVERYGRELSFLQPEAVPPPITCGEGYHCGTRAKCFTDFYPHFNRELTLEDVIVGDTNWTYCGQRHVWSHRRERSVSTHKYGYLDGRPLWTAIDRYSGEIHLRLDIGEADYAWVCGFFEKALDHVSFFLDVHASAGLKQEGNITVYLPSNSRILWTNVTSKPQDCKELRGLPRGKHVLSILNNATLYWDKPKRKNSWFESALTHLITWP